MTFANPSFLWAFAGVAVPLAIHLLSRKEGKIVRVGSLRHVDESNTSQFKSVRLNEIFLLLLRCLMITTIVLLMSGAQCAGRLDKNIKWVVAERGVNVDSLVAKGYEFHEMPAENYWTYIDDLNNLPYDIIVISFSRADNFRGQRVILNDNIRWLTAESRPTEFQALAWAVGDSVFVRTGKSNSMMTAYHTSVAVPDSISVLKPSIINVSTNDMIATAALNTLKKEYRLPIQITSDQQPITKILVTPSIGPLVERISPTEIHINKNPDQDVALNENLVIELFKVLYPGLQKSEVSKDVRVLPEELAFSNKKEVKESAIVNTGIEKYLVALFIISLAIERLVAIRRNQ